MKKILFTLLLVTLLSLVACSASANTLEYSHGLNFVIAIDNPDVDNVDHLEAGTYTFDVTNNKMGEAPMYDIYITNEYHTSLKDLGDITYTIGGVGATAKDITLESGQYVYIVSSDLVYEAKGHLKVTKKQ